MVTRSFCLLVLLALSAAAQTPRIPPPESVNRNGLVGRWLWDGGVGSNTAVNFTSPNFAGLMFGGGTRTRLQHRSGFRLVPNTAFVKVGKPDSAGSKSVAMWVYAHSLTVGYLASNYTATSDGFSVLLNTDGTIGVAWTSGVNAVRTTSAVTTGKWYHVVATLSTGGAIYINGKLEKAGSLGAEKTSPYTLRIGGRWTSNDESASAATPDCTVDDARYYNRALSATEVAMIYRGLQ
jgi:hypothetical protein